ncbi:hypothetical protein HYW21_05390 [Candidatus Woesearchaeota archaeon]|nr:hypothetical protein [Candidatus Woesearchaeota archaeon]
MSPPDPYPFYEKVFAWISGLTSLAPRAAVATEGLRRYDSAREASAVTPISDPQRRDGYLNAVIQRASFNGICDLLAEGRSPGVQAALATELLRIYDVTLERAVHRLSDHFRQGPSSTRPDEDAPRLEDVPRSVADYFEADEVLADYNLPHTSTTINLFLGLGPRMRERVRSLMDGHTVTSPTAQTNLHSIMERGSREVYTQMATAYITSLRE